MINQIEPKTRMHILLLFFLLFFIKSEAQDINFDTASISSELKKNASVVVRNENIEFEVSEVGQAKLHVHRIETVLSEKGKDALYFSQQTDKFILLDDIEIKVYDAAGKTIKKVKQHDFNTIAGVLEFIDDYKTWYLNINVASYPVTIETDYRIKYKGTLRYPTYQILKPEQGVEHSSFQARIKKDMGLRYKEKNIHLSPVIITDGDYNVYTWSVENLRPVNYEENAVSYESRYPSVTLAPNQFKLGEYPGDMTSWKNFGLWYSDLLAGVDTIPDQRKEFYRELVKNATDDREKEKILYRYLQKNFRYVSIQLGIGGFRPIPADITDANKYGDCKGLSNYLVTALRSVGIKSYLALINAESNREPVDEDFPCNLFNHIIICIPGKKDSVWLECTSKTADFGVLGSFTENRFALLITDTGGVLVPTPRSRATENTIQAFTTIDMNTDGSGKTSTIITARGEYKQQMMGLRDEKADDQKLFLINHWGFKDPSRISFDTASGQQSNIQLSLDQQLEKIPELKTGNKMFLRPSIPDLWTVRLPKAENRQQDFYFDCPFVKTDTTVLKLPNGYGVDALPQSVTDSCKYARYASRCWYDEKSRQVYTAASIVLHEYKIPAGDYGTVKNFFDAILMGKDERIVIKKE